MAQHVLEDLTAPEDEARLVVRGPHAEERVQQRVQAAAQVVAGVALANEGAADALHQVGPGEEQLLVEAPHVLRRVLEICVDEAHVHAARGVEPRPPRRLDPAVDGMRAHDEVGHLLREQPQHGRRRVRARVVYQHDLAA